MTLRRERGQAGERIAAEYLAHHGYEIVTSNWRTRFGEIDIVARQGGTLVFVEVRTRTTDTFGTPAESVGPRKQRQLVHMAEQYQQRLAPGAAARIDVITVFLGSGAPSVEHLIGVVDGR